MAVEGGEQRACSAPLAEFCSQLSLSRTQLSLSRAQLVQDGQALHTPAFGGEVRWQLSIDATLSEGRA